MKMSLFKNLVKENRN